MSPRTLIILCILGATTAPLASGTMKLVAAAWLPLDAALPGDAPVAEATRRQRDPDAILARGPLAAPRVVVPPPHALAASPCDGSLRLVAAVSGDASALAEITDATGRSALYHTGDAVGALALEQIAPTSVVLRGGDTTCTLALFL